MMNVFKSKLFKGAVAVLISATLVGCTSPEPLTDEEYEIFFSTLIEEETLSERFEWLKEYHERLDEEQLENSILQLVPVIEDALFRAGSDIEPFYDELKKLEELDYNKLDKVKNEELRAVIEKYEKEFITFVPDKYDTGATHVLFNPIHILKELNESLTESSISDFAMYDDMYMTAYFLMDTEKTKKEMEENYLPMLDERIALYEELGYYEQMKDTFEFIQDELVKEYVGVYDSLHFDEEGNLLEGTLDSFKKVSEKYEHLSFGKELQEIVVKLEENQEKEETIVDDETGEEMVYRDVDRMVIEKHFFADLYEPVDAEEAFVPNEEIDSEKEKEADEE